jgi:hypothetical protein
MKKEVEYQKCFDVVSEIDFGGLLTEDGHHVVTIRRYYPDGIFDTETIVCFVGWGDDGELMLDKLHNCTEEEFETIREMMDSIQESGSW